MNKPMRQSFARVQPLTLVLPDFLGQAFGVRGGAVKGECPDVDMTPAQEYVEDFDQRCFQNFRLSGLQVWEFQDKGFPASVLESRSAVSRGNRLQSNSSETQKPKHRNSKAHIIVLTHNPER